MLLEFVFSMLVVVSVLLPFMIISYYLNIRYRRAKVKIEVSKDGNVFYFKRKR